MLLGLQDQGSPLVRRRRWTLTYQISPSRSLPHVHYPPVLQYTSLLSSIPCGLTPTASCVQVLVTTLRTPLHLSLLPRNRLLFVITLISASVVLMVATKTASHCAGTLVVFSASALDGYDGAWPGFCWESEIRG